MIKNLAILGLVVFFSYGAWQWITSPGGLLDITLGITLLILFYAMGWVRG